MRVVYHRDMRAWIAALILVSTTAAARADGPKLSADAKAHYKTALAKARKLQAAKKYADATAAFDDALAAAPGDATVLGELGWTAFLAKDYKTAEAMTRKALAAQGAPSVRGATLYNLGLIEEQNGDKPGAIASYTASIKARPNAVVAARLKTLDPNAAAAVAPLALDALTGYATIDDYCKAAPKTDDPENCSCGDPIDGARAIKVATPFSAAQTVVEDCGHGQGNRNYDIAVQLAGKWYVEYLNSNDLSMGCSGELTINSVTTHGGMLLVDSTTIGSCPDDMADSADEWSQRRISVLGIGASHKVAAAMIAIGDHDEKQATPKADKPPPPVVSRDLALTLTWTGDTTFTLAGKTTGTDKIAAAAMLGNHTLVFP